MGPVFLELDARTPENGHIFLDISEPQTDVQEHLFFDSSAPETGVEELLFAASGYRLVEVEQLAAGLGSTRKDASADQCG